VLRDFHGPPAESLQRPLSRADFRLVPEGMHLVFDVEGTNCPLTFEYAHCEGPIFDAVYGFRVDDAGEGKELVSLEPAPDGLRYEGKRIHCRDVRYNETVMALTRLREALAAQLHGPA
jgi:hypothetical protein